MDKPEIKLTGSIENVRVVDLSTEEYVDRPEVAAMVVGAVATSVEHAGGDFIIEPRDESPIISNVIPFRRRR